MVQVIQIQWTAANVEEAKKVCLFLVEKRLVACAQILPSIESIYIWEGKVCSSMETKVLLKTKEDNFSLIQDYILKNTSYKLPEILKFNVSGFDLYLSWVFNSC